MSIAVLKGNASGTGTVTLETPNTNTDRTITLPDATAVLAFEDSSGNLQVNSGYGSKATAYGCRAWVNFNGTGTVAIRASGNVSSITDNGTGDYTVNFTNALPDTNYSITSSGANALPLSASQGFNNGTASASTSTSAARVVCFVNSTTAVTDLEVVNVSVFR